MMRSQDLEKQFKFHQPWATMKDWEIDSLLEIPTSTSVELNNGNQEDYFPSFPFVSSEVKDTGNEKNEKSPEPPQDDEEERGFLPVLRNKNFLALWSGQLFSQLADKVYLVLMIAIISTRFQQADQTISGWVSAIMMAFTIPAVLFGAGAGVFVDRWSKQAVLVITNLLRGGLVLALPLVLWLFQGQYFGQLPVGFYILLITTFLVSTLTQFFAPAEQSAIPLIVEKRHLLSANSLYTTTMMASVIVGFAVGEPLLALADLMGNSLGFESIGKEVIVGGEYVIAGLILLLLKTKENNNNSPHEQPHILEDLRDGIRYLSNHTLIRNALLQLIILFSIFAALAVLAVRLAEIIPEISSSQFGFLLAAGGAGMGIGATILGHLGHRLTHFQLALIGSMGVASSLVGLSIFNQQLWPTLILILSLGIFGAIVAIPMQTTIQAETPEEMRGKVFGLQNNAINIALSLPLALAGVAETLIGLSNVFLSLAGLAMIGGFVTWLISRNAPHLVESEVGEEK